jgi:hypothetical protein
MHRYFILTLLSLLTFGCATTSPQNQTQCQDGVPCWVTQHPNEGVVVSMAQHIDPAKTREVLFNKAIVELAARSEGMNVSQDSIISKRVHSVNGNVDERSQVSTLSAVNTGGNEVNVKAKIKAHWKDPMTHKLYLWVIMTN